MAHMILPQRSNFLLSQPKIRATTKDLSANVHTVSKSKTLEASQDVDLQKIGRIKEMFGKPELSVSSYDTAWVAMVPAQGSPNRPSFPQCLDWIMENQQPNGSWGLHSTHPKLVKDSLSSTLACVLALQKWSAGEQLIQRGLDFIGSNKFALLDRGQFSPIGFDVLFSGMISQAKGFGLNLPLDSSSVDVMLRNYDLEIQRYSGLKNHLAYVAEGLGKSNNWKEVMINQRSNGSLFNSPATTAAALTHLRDDKSFDYVDSVLKLYGDAVPTIFPSDISIPLRLVNTLEKLGIERHFRNEIENVLEETYRRWQQRSEDIFLDVSCCAMAFRLLRMNGYEVSSDDLSGFTDQVKFFNTISLQFKTTETILELYRAAETTIYESEPVLEKIYDWTRNFLQQQYLTGAIGDEKLHNEVEYALEYSNMGLDKLVHRRNIELYNSDDFEMLKTSYRLCNIDKKEIHRFSLQDFNRSQAVHNEELKELEKWVKDAKLDSDGMNFDWWHTLIACHCVVTGVLIPPELSDARMAWSKSIIAATGVDDMFEIDGTMEEMRNIVELFERWDDYLEVGFASKRNEILFYATYDMINDFASKALAKQGRCIKHHLIELQVNFVKTQMKEIEWWMSKTSPTVEEYLLNGIDSSAVGLYCKNIFFVGPPVSEEMWRSEEFRSVYNGSGTITRMLNDYRTDEREREQRKLECVTLLVNESNGTMDYEQAREYLRKVVEKLRRETLRVTLRRDGIVPREIKDSIWKYSKIMHYASTSDYKLRPGKKIDRELLYEPLKLPYEI